MYGRMLNKQEKPAMEEMKQFCGENGDRFLQLNEWIETTYQTQQSIVFPYGNSYGWGVSHKKKSKLICNVFAEEQAFTVMIRLTNKQFDSIYEQVQPETQKYIDNKFPCNDGGWIHYRVTGKEQLEDIKKIIAAKC